MAGFTTCMPDSFRKELFSAVHNFLASGGHTFKFGLAKAQASLTGTYNKGTVNYSTITGNSDELANGSGYTTAGVALTNVDPSIPGSNVAITDFSNDPQWTSATFTSRAGFIHNTSASGKIVSLHDYGSDQAVTSGTFTVIMPAADATNAILRLA